MMNARETVEAAVKAIFVDFDAQLAEALLAPGYIQHNTGVPTGAAPILGFIPALKASGLRVTTHRALSEGDLVVLHNTYENAAAFGAPTLAAFDLFRVEDGRVAEHWDNLQPLAAPNPSGRGMTDGVAHISDRERTAANKGLVLRFAEAILVGGQAARLGEFLSPETYIQHNPLVADGIEGLGAALAQFAAAGRAIRYDRVHKSVAEGDFVFLMSSGWMGETPTAYFDLFRVANGRIVEHWDVVSAIPAQMAHANGKF